MNKMHFDITKSKEHYYVKCYDVILEVLIAITITIFLPSSITEYVWCSNEEVLQENKKK